MLGSPAVTNLPAQAHTSSIPELAGARLGMETHGLRLACSHWQGLTSKVAHGVRKVKKYIGKVVPAPRLWLPLHHVATSSCRSTPRCAGHSGKCDKRHAGLCHPRRCQGQLDLMFGSEPRNPAVPSPSPLLPTGGMSRGLPMQK